MKKKEYLKHISNKKTTVICRDTMLVIAGDRLEGIVRAAELLADNAEPVATWDAKNKVLWIGDPSTSFSVSEPIPLSYVKSAYVQWVVDRSGGDKTAAAKVLGIDVKTIYNYSHQGKINVGSMPRGRRRR